MIEFLLLLLFSGQCKRKDCKKWRMQQIWKNKLCFRFLFKFSLLCKKSCCKKLKVFIFWNLKCLSGCQSDKVDVGRNGETKEMDPSLNVTFVPTLVAAHIFRSESWPTIININIDNNNSNNSNSISPRARTRSKAWSSRARTIKDSIFQPLSNKWQMKSYFQTLIW